MLYVLRPRPPAAFELLVTCAVKPFGLIETTKARYLYF
jgi:hypothetical protein